MPDAACTAIRSNYATRSVASTHTSIVANNDLVVLLSFCMSTTANVPHPLPAPLVEVIAERFRVLGEPMRIRLLDALREAPATVQELQQATGASQQNVSKHLGVLLRSGLVSRSKEGNFSLYAIADEDVFELCDHVCGGLRRQLDELDAVLPGGTG